MTQSTNSDAPAQTAIEQAMSAAKYPHTFSHQTAIKEEVDAAWKTLSVTAVAAENSEVGEYIRQIEAERDALREWESRCAVALGVPGCAAKSQSCEITTTTV